MPNACVDTNLWFYALVRPAVGEETKHQAARRFISKLDRPLVTPQILNELTFNLLRKRAWSEPELRELIIDLRLRCRFFVPGADWHEQASLWREKYALSFWDSLVVAAAHAGSCAVLFSEDMQHGLRIDTLEIVNPFAVGTVI